MPLSEDPKICLLITSIDKKFTLKQGLKAHRGSRGIALLFIGSRWGWVVNATPLPFYPHERDPKACVDGHRKSCHNRIRSLDCPVHSKSTNDYTIQAHSLVLQLKIN